MKRRHQFDIPALRAGCYPQSGLPNPPHSAIGLADDLLIKIIPSHAFDTLPAISVPDGQTTLISDEPLMEAVTANGWRCYLRLSDRESLLTLLNLASAGRFGVHSWMQGIDFNSAWQIAEQTTVEETHRREQARSQHSSPPADLPDLDDIEI